MPDATPKQRLSCTPGWFCFLSAALILLASIASCSLVHIPSPAHQPVDVIYDDDCDGDIDCAITQPIFNHWIDIGYVKAWGVVSSGHSRLGAPTLRLFRDYYGHSSLFPVGAWLPGCESKSSAPWNVAVVNKFDPGDTCANYPSCVQVLRQSMVRYAATGATHGLNYVITGPLSCEEEFRNSLPDSISRLTGEQMEQLYIKQFVVMNGIVHSGHEFNCDNDVPACAAFFAYVTSQNGYPPVYVVPNNTGAGQVITEVPVASLPSSNPTAYAFAFQGTTGDTDEDSLALEYAIYENWGWLTSPDSTNVVNPATGLNSWNSQPSSGQFYLEVVADPELFELLLENSWLPSH